MRKPATSGFFASQPRSPMRPRARTVVPRLAPCGSAANGGSLLPAGPRSRSTPQTFALVAFGWCGFGVLPPEPSFRFPRSTHPLARQGEKHHSVHLPLRGQKDGSCVTPPALEKSAGRRLPPSPAPIWNIMRKLVRGTGFGHGFLARRRSPGPATPARCLACWLNNAPPFKS